MGRTIRKEPLSLADFPSPESSLHWMVQVSYSAGTLAYTGKDVLKCLRRLLLGACSQVVCRACFEFKMI